MQLYYMLFGLNKVAKVKKLEIEVRNYKNDY